MLPTTPMPKTDNMMNVCSQLFKLLLCQILLVSALPFIALAGIFSLITDIPHIKIELGNKNVVEKVNISLVHTNDAEDSDSEDEDENEDEDDSGNDGDISENDEEDESDINMTIIPNNELADFLGVEHNTQIPHSKLIKLMDDYIEEYGSATGTQKINWDPKLWKLLNYHKRTLTYCKMYDILSTMYTIVPSTPKMKGRVGGFEDNFPSTPVRKIRSKSESNIIDSPISVPPLDIAQLEALMKDELTLDTGVKVRATSPLNDADIRPIPCESFEKEDGEQTPSECPPSS